MVATVSCDMTRKDEDFISQMVAIVAALSDDAVAALTFTEQQATAFIQVCTQAIQRGRDDPYRIGAYELYILSSEDQVHLYAILTEEAQGVIAEAGSGITASQVSAGDEQSEAIERNVYVSLAIGDEGEEVLALKKRLFELGYFSSDNYSDSYNDVTARRVILFQQANGLTDTGIASPEMQALLFSDNAVKCPIPLDD